MRHRFTVLTLLTLFPLVALAVGTPTEDNRWYYEIGGADPVSVPPNPTVNPVVLGGQARFGLGYSCGRFDPVLSVTNLLENFRLGADPMVDGMVAAAYNILAALPALILQRAVPDLYDLFQTHLVDAQRRVSLAFKSCEQMEAEIATGKNPYEEWVQLAKAQGWKDRMVAGEDVVVAKESVEGTGGDDGLPWIFGDQGGIGQEPIAVLHDTAVAGYNVTQNRSPAADPGAVASGSRLSETWATPEAAARWAVEVLGDDIVRTCQDCARSAQPGTGLVPKYYATREEVVPGIVDLVRGAVEPTFENLDAQSAPSVGLSRALIEAIRGLPPAEQGIVVGRLAGEVAQGRTIEQALLIRRVLLTGRRVPEVAGYTVAAGAVDAAVAELEQEIDNLLFETRVRREVVSKTASVVLGRDLGRRERALPQAHAPEDDPNILDEGRIEP